MEDHFVSSEDDYRFNPADEVIISYYLTMMINNCKSWPTHFLRDEDARLYILDPWRLFHTHNPNFYVFVKRRTEACGKTDGCETGCWRIMARDKLIKSEETGKLLGFKKILKFCDKEKKLTEEEQRIWVMEEYRLVDKWKQDQVICRIRLLVQPALSYLLAKHFSFLSKWTVPYSRRRFLPLWDLYVPEVPKDEIISYYLKMLVDGPNGWPSHFLQSEQVYGVVPWRIVNALQSSFELQEGRYFFVNRTENSGRTDGCRGGCWRIIRRDRVITSNGNKILGIKRMFKFCDKGKPQPVYKFWEDEKFKENEFKMTWIMDEYRLAKKKLQGKVICRIKLLSQYHSTMRLIITKRNFTLEIGNSMYVSHVDLISFSTRFCYSLKSIELVMTDWFLYNFVFSKSNTVFFLGKSLSYKLIHCCDQNDIQPEQFRSQREVL